MKPKRARPITMICSDKNQRHESARPKTLEDALGLSKAITRFAKLKAIKAKASADFPKNGRRSSNDFVGEI